MCELVSPPKDSDDRDEIAYGILFLGGLANAFFHLPYVCAPAHNWHPLGYVLGIWTSIWSLATVAFLLLMMAGKGRKGAAEFLACASPLALPAWAALYTYRRLLAGQERKRVKKSEERTANCRRRRERWNRKLAAARIPENPTSVVLFPDQPIDVISEAV